MKPLLIFAISAATAVGSTSRCASEGRPRSLFNGRDLSGWHVDVPAADTNVRLRNPFLVRNGVLVSLGEPRGHLITDSSYRDYRLEVEYRFPAAPGNSGVLVHASTPRALYGMFPRSIEVQMEHGNAGDFWCILEDIRVSDMERRRGPPATWGTTEGKARRILNLTDSSEKPVGEWNTMVIEAVSRSIRVWVNGDLVNDGSDATADHGQIALQSEGSEVEFRKLLLTPIDRLTIPRGTVKDSDAVQVGERIIMLRGLGEVHHSGTSLATTAVGINLVTPVVRLERRRVWVVSTSGDDSGWVDVGDVIPLKNAVGYFANEIQRDPNGWGAYLRRAEAEHSLNQRDAATIDYSRAIELHPTEAFLYLRRGRHYNTLKDCGKALSDFAQGIRLAPTSAPQGYNLEAELYSLESGVYAGCPDTTYRDDRRALSTALRAIELDPSRPTLLTILAFAYFGAGDCASAIAAQKRALASPRFPPNYQVEAVDQLHVYENAVGAATTPPQPRCKATS
ncbi:MAG TPA: family 16 glycoside hydrolase [Gemmatimonadaceae bacterium]